MDLSKFLERAEAALRKRMPEQAITLYRQMLVASPGHGGARAGLMAAYRKRSELKGGPSIIDKAAARSMYAAALGLRSSGRHAAVVRSCDTGLERDPNDTHLATLLGDALEALGHKEEALAAWLSVLEADPKNLPALKAAARLHYAVKQIPQAMECLERAHVLDKHDPEVERLRKNLAAEGTLAASNYTTATSSRDVIRDKDSLRRNEQSQRLQRSADTLGQDIDALTVRHREDPGNSDLRRQLVKSLQEAGRGDEAEGVLVAALERAPGDESVQDALGDCRLARNEAALKVAHAAGDAATEQRLREERTALEITEFERRVRLAPGDGALRLRLARAQYRAGAASASGAATATGATGPAGATGATGATGAASAAGAADSAAAAAGATDRAIEHFQAIVADPRYTLDARQGLGACFFRKGLYPLAARQFEAAMAACGGLGSDRGKEICYHLGLVCERQNDRSGAAARYLQIYEVDISYRDVAAKIEALKT